MPIFQQFEQQKWQIIDRYLSDRRPLKFFRDFTQLIDRTIQNVWQATFIHEPHLCLLAVGGFGRGEMYPHSDLDLAIVSEQALTESQHQLIAQFVQTLWDAQFHPAVRSGSVAELCESARHDLTADTAFLEARYLSGSRQTAQRCLKKITEQRDLVAFIEGKLLEMQQRHAKQSNTTLEPNIKTAAGGLRDIHTMTWLAKVQDLSGNIYHPHHNRVLNRTESGLLRNSHRVLSRIRIELHLATGREEDRLTFDLQKTLAANLNIVSHNQLPSEKLMHQVYRAFKTIRQLNDIILPMLAGRVYSNIPRQIIDLDENYYSVGNKIAAKDVKLFETQPEHLFILIEKLQQNRQLNGIAPKTLRHWWTASQLIDAHFCENENNRARFIHFFHHGEGLTHMMRLLNLYGILGRYVPQWNKIVGLLQHDLFHIYPVDDHILTVLRNVRRLAIDSFSHEMPFASGLMHNFEPKYVLYLAALFHDIAKGRNGDHAKLGVTDATQFAQHHHLPPEHADLMAWLVQEHLLMSQVAQKQDIYDPHVVANFCKRVENPTRLTALYLLTVADIRGTNPKIWNSWKAQLLERLFQAAMQYFSGSLKPSEQLAHSRQQQAYDLLSQFATPKQIKQLWQVLGSAYFVSHTPDMMEWHLPLMVAQPEKAVTNIVSLHDNLIRILVYMPNADRLFTRLCRLVSQFNLDIVAARAFITEHNFILDTFYVTFSERTLPEEYATIQAALLAKLNQFIEQPFEIENKIKTKSRRVQHQPLAPSLVIQPDDEAQHWYSIDIIAANRNALLADITEIFAQHQVRLRHAKIATMDERVEDSFLVHAPQWQDNPLQQWAFQRDLLAQLN